MSADTAPCLHYPERIVVGMQMNGSVPHLPDGRQLGKARGLQLSHAVAQLTAACGSLSSCPQSRCFEAELGLCHYMPSIYHLACPKSCHSCLWLTSFSYQCEIVSEGPPLSSVSASGWFHGNEQIRLVFLPLCPLQLFLKRLGLLF